MVLWTGLGNWLPNDKELYPGDYHDVDERVWAQGWRAGLLPGSSAVVRWPHELFLTWSDLNFSIYQVDGVGEGNFISACPKTWFTYSCNQFTLGFNHSALCWWINRKIKLVFLLVSSHRARTSTHKGRPLRMHTISWTHNPPLWETVHSAEMQFPPRLRNLIPRWPVDWREASYTAVLCFLQFQVPTHILVFEIAYKAPFSTLETKSL